VAPAFDVAKIKSELVAAIDTKMNERIAGIQSSFQSQINERDQTIRELKLASLSEDERETVAEQEGEEYVAELERKVQLAELAEKYPDVVPHFKKLLASKTPEEQAEYLNSLLHPQAPEPEPEQQVPDVDPNNPAPTASASTGQRLPDGTPLTPEFAEQFLKSLGDTPISRWE
jgi:hypothetical protein